MRWLARCLVLALVISGAASAAIVDPDVTSDDFLASLADDLEQRGVDVRHGVSADGPPPEAKPQLTRLANLQAQMPPEAEASTDRFDALFQAGAFSEAALIAVRTDEVVVDLGAEQMRQLWNRTEMHNRVFISYSGRDAAYADAVRSVLEARGFVVFTYLPPDSATPLTNSVEVGQYFKEAGHHLLIDTANARASKAIALEAAAWHVVTGFESPQVGGGMPPDPPRAAEPVPAVVTPTPAETTPPPPAEPPPAAGPDAGSEPPPDANGGGTDSEGEPCCQLCTYRNGVLEGCGPVECGVQCRGAQ